MMPILTARRPPSSAMTMGHCWYSSCRSMLLPVVVKKRPNSSDLKGRMSASTWHREAMGVQSEYRSSRSGAPAQSCSSMSTSQNLQHLKYPLDLCNTCDRKLVSESSTPAAKAPAVSEKPRRWVMSDAPVTVSRHSATKVSSLRDSATTCLTATNTINNQVASPLALLTGLQSHLGFSGRRDDVLS